MIGAGRGLNSHVLVPPPTPGGLTRIASDPVRFVNDAVEGSTNLVGAVLKFAANLIAPEEDDGTKATHAHTLYLQVPEVHNI